MSKELTEDQKQVLDEIIVLIESDLMREVVAARVIRKVTDSLLAK